MIRLYGAGRPYVDVIPRMADAPAPAPRPPWC
jgi:hypothetical protein